MKKVLGVILVLLSALFMSSAFADWEPKPAAEGSYPFVADIYEDVTADDVTRREDVPLVEGGGVIASEVAGSSYFRHSTRDSASATSATDHVVHIGSGSADQGVRSNVVAWSTDMPACRNYMPACYKPNNDG